MSSGFCPIVAREGRRRGILAGMGGRAGNWIQACRRRGDVEPVALTEPEGSLTREDDEIFVTREHPPERGRRDAIPAGRHPHARSPLEGGIPCNS
jgi:hypothetical protein